jgi:hypothetical protein
MSRVIELTNGSRAPSADVCRIKARRRREMKSMRRAAQSRFAGYGLDTLREFVIAPVIFLGLPMVCAAPLLFLYWLYRPTVLTNPGLSVRRAPVAMALLLPPSQPEPREDVGTSSQAAPADVAEAFDEPGPANRKLKSPPGSRGSHSIASRRPLRFAGNARRPAPAYNVGAAVTNPGQYTGMSRSAASAYAYAVEQSGRYRW